MAFPTQHEIEIPLLLALKSLGGSAKPKQIYPLVAKSFPQLTEEDLNQRLESSQSTHKWWNLVQWVRQSLIEKGELDGTIRGIWKVTEKGIARLDKHSPTNKKAAIDKIETEITLRDMVNQTSDSIRRRLVDELNGLSPHGFEKFCLSLLDQLGYENLQVTKKSGDGGIDGFGDFRQGVVRIKSAFQSKRWKKNPVSRPDIDTFRGAISGEFDHGVYLTTNRFTSEAQAASIKRGAIPIMLLDGQSIADLMIEKGFGVRKQTVYLLEIDEEFFDFDDNEDA